MQLSPYYSDNKTKILKLQTAPSNKRFDIYIQE